MAGGFKMSKKKTAIIIGATVAILVTLAVTGTVVFLKDRGSAEAAGTGNEQQVSGEQVATENEVPNTQEDAIAGTDGETAGAEGTTTEGGVAEGTVAGDATEGETTTTTTGGAGTTAGATDRIEETTITRTEEVEIPEKKVAEGHYVGWTPMEIDAEIASANITAEEDEIVVGKKGNETVAQGEQITYEITVTNKTEEDLKNIEVKDRILDENILDMSTVEFVTNQDGVNNLVTAPGTVNGNVITWNVDIEAGETITIIFKATVKTDVPAGTIVRNTVVANGKEIDKPVETIVTEATKNVTVEKIWTGDEQVARNVRPSNLTINLENNIKD